MIGAMLPRYRYNNDADADVNADNAALGSSWHQGDFVVVSGDLILDSDFLRDMIDLHHIHEPAVTVLFKPYVATSTSAKKRALATQDFIGLVEAESPREPTRFVFSKPMSTVTETLGVRKSLLRRYLGPATLLLIVILLSNAQHTHMCHHDIDPDIRS